MLGVTLCLKIPIRGSYSPGEVSISVAIRLFVNI